VDEHLKQTSDKGEAELSDYAIKGQAQPWDSATTRAFDGSRSGSPSTNTWFVKLPPIPTLADASSTATFGNASLFSPSSIAKGKEAVSDHAIERETPPLHAATAEQGKQLDDILSSGAWSDASSMITFDNASIFSNQSTSTWQSSVYDPLGAAEDFIALLLSDGLLHPLFSVAREAIDPQTFKVELHHLLRKYTNDLSKEAQGPLDKTAINFVRRYRRRIAYAVGDDVYQDDAEKKRGKLRVVQDSDSSDDENENDEELSNFQRVKEFLINSRAFERFKAGFVEFILRWKLFSPTIEELERLPTKDSDPSRSLVDATEANVEVQVEKPPCSEPLESFSVGIVDEGSFLSIPSPQEYRIPGSFSEVYAENNAMDPNDVKDEIGLFQKLHCFLARSFRPATKPGFRRIEWFCVEFLGPSSKKVR
jgi:hypothetical protein